MTDVRHPVDGTEGGFEGGGRRVGWSLFLLVLTLAAPIVHHVGEQQASRLAFTAAVWDHQTLEIDRYEAILGRDRAVVDGVTYSDKAPAQPLLALPFYGVYRLLGGEPAEIPRDTGNWGLWWLTVWSAAVPAAALAMLMYRWARELSPGSALPAAISLAVGTLLLPYATLLFAHVLTSLLVFLAFLLIRDRSASPWRLAGAGVMAGLSVLTEYPTALVVVVILVAAAAVHRVRVLWTVAGGLPAAAAMFFYNAAVFGSPLVFPYQWSAWTQVKDRASDLSAVALQEPSFDPIWQALFHQRGFLIATPVVVLAFVGIYLGWRRGHRLDSLVAAGAVIAMFGLIMTRGNPFAGGPGPRYFIPALPFLAAPFALVWGRYRRVAFLAASLSVLTMLAATITEPQLGPTFDAGVGFWLRRASVGLLTDTVFTLTSGSVGWLLHASAVGVALWVVVRSRTRFGRSAQALETPQGPEIRGR